MLKKVFNSFIAIICIMSLIIPHLNVVLAAALTNDSSSLVMSVDLITSAYHEGGAESSGCLSEENQENYDNNPYKYIAKSDSNQTSILKILRNDDSDPNTGAKLFSDAFYCLDGNNSFPSINGAITYNRTIMDFFEENPISLGLSDDNYNSLCWLVDNMYLRKQLTQSQRATYKNLLIEDAFEEVLSDTSEPCTTVDDIKAVLTDDDIEIVQQWAIWYFTNYDETTIQGVPFVNYDGEENLTLPIICLQDTSLEEDSLVGTRYEYLNILYNYFVKEAQDYSSIEINRIYPEIENKSINCEIDGEYYKLGAFKVKSGSEDVNYEITLTDGENVIPSDKYIIKDENGTVIDEPINDILDEEYYVYILITDCDYSRVQLNLSYDNLETKASVWQADEEDYQPVILITKEGEIVRDNVSVEIEKCFDLSLIKYIDTVENSSESTEYFREPVFQYESGEFNYETTKDPVEVKVGDTVYYVIRVYNEGQVDGYASEICDDIPKGLRYDPDNDVNQMYGWVMYDKNGDITSDSSQAVKVKTDYLSKEKAQQDGEDRLIKAFNLSTEEIDYEQVCVAFVVEDSAKDKTIINTAEITDDSDKNGNEIDDKDSIPDNNDQDEDDIDQEKIQLKIFDLNLKKFITKVNGVNIDESREPIVDVEPLKNGENDAAYETKKDPIRVNIGDKVTYKIRIYNEGSRDGYADEIIDYIPAGLGYLNEYNGNIDNFWRLDTQETKLLTLGDITNGTNNLSVDQFFEVNNLEDATVISALNTSYIRLISNALEYSMSSEENCILAFDPTNDYLDYKDIEITCVVLSDEGLKNIAEILEDTDCFGANVTDRDSEPNTVNPDEYPGNDETQDDNDIEYLTVNNCDLSLKKFITNVNDDEITDRIPQVSYQDGEFIYTKNMEPVEVNADDEITYTLRVYNEGDVDCYASEVYDDIPEGLIFDPTNSTNIEYGWVMYDVNGNVTSDANNAVKVRTDYLSKEKSQQRGTDALLHAFDLENRTIDYQDVKIVFSLSSNNSSSQVIINTAEISDITDEDGNEIEDKDSTPDNGDENEDDLDKERIKTGIFDLSLEKFITGVNDSSVTDREPEISYNDGEFSFTHPTDPLDVNTGDTVVYTIRVYNEGTVDGYAEEVCDDIPEGLVFDPNNSINKEYEWVMYDENNNEVTDNSKAKKIKTQYLSQSNSEDNIIEAFDGDNLFYADVKVAFTVTATLGDNVLINTAEITDDADGNGNEIEDVDSTPNNGNEDEDDIDKERIKVGYFDLALSKDLVKAVVTENNSVKEIESKNGSLVKVEINRKNINSTIVKFVYNITVTNQGNIAGYVTGIKDYIPDGLEFVESDNQNWTKSSTGVIENNSLAKTLIQPGESQTVQVVLRWVNGESNLGLKVNIAEISSDYNNANDVNDIDSTPDNGNLEEDDIDSAEVLLSISTGKAQNYILGIIVLAGAVGTGLIISRKFIF